MLCDHTYPEGRPAAAVVQDNRTDPALRDITRPCLASNHASQYAHALKLILVIHDSLVELMQAKKGWYFLQVCNLVSHPWIHNVFRSQGRLHFDQSGGHLPEAHEVLWKEEIGWAPSYGFPCPVKDWRELGSLHVTY